MTKHRRVVALPNLPKGFTVGEAVLGRHRVANERIKENHVPNAPVPVVNVDSETERMPAPDVTVTLAADEKKYECRLTFNPRQTLKIKDYATHHGYYGDKGTPLLINPSSCRPVTRSPCRPGAARRVADEFNAPRCRRREACANDAPS